MRSELKNIELIENYLLGNLNNDQKKSFEFELQNNLRLKEEVDTQKKLMLGLSLLAFTNDIKAYHPEFIAQEGTGGKFKWFLNSLLVIVVTGITSLVIFFNGGNKNEKNNSYKNDQNSSQITDKNNNQDVLLAINDSNSQVKYLNANHGSNSQSIGNNQLLSLTNKRSKTTLSSSKAIKNPTVMEPGDYIPVQDTIVNDSLLSDRNKINEDIFNRLQVPFEEVKIQAHLGGNFITKKSKSKFTIPAGILQNTNGETVNGEVTIKYREWRNAAEMAFCQIPMTHHENGEDFNFNSAGMFEIRAYQNGKELEISPEKTISVEFKVTEKLDSCYFWSLNDKTQKWTKLDTLNYSNNNAMRKNVVDMYDGGRYFRLFGRKLSIGPRTGVLTGSIKDNKQGEEKNMSDKYYISKRVLFFFYKNQKISPNYIDTGYVYSYLKRGTYKAELKDGKYSDMIVNKVRIKKNKVTELDFTIDLKKNQKNADYKTDYSLRHTNINSQQFISSLYNDSIYYNDYMSKAYAEQMHNQSLLFQTLHCNKFGVYNCDQIKRINQPVSVRPSFTNSSNDEIKPASTSIVSMIDLKRNAAFSFGAKEFTCSANGKNVVLLFSENKIYAIQNKEFSELKINKSGKYNLKMEDITDSIHSTKDLEKYLGL